MTKQQTKQQSTMLERLLDSGRTQPEIACELGVSVGTLFQRRRELGLPRLPGGQRRKTKAPDHVLEMARLRKAGLRWSEIAKLPQYNCTRQCCQQTVAFWLNRLPKELRP